MEPNAKLSIRTAGGEVHIAITDSQGTREKSIPVPFWPRVRRFLEDKTGKTIQLREGRYNG